MKNQKHVGVLPIQPREAKDVGIHPLGAVCRQAADGFITACLNSRAASLEESSRKASKNVAWGLPCQPAKGCGHGIDLKMMQNFSALEKTEFAYK